MKVRMRVYVSGTYCGRDWPPVGETVDLPDDDGAHLCAAGIAEPVAELPEAVAETAVPPAPEKRAAVRKGRSS